MGPTKRPRSMLRLRATYLYPVKATRSRKLTEDARKYRPSLIRKTSRSWVTKHEEEIWTSNNKHHERGGVGKGLDQRSEVQTPVNHLRVHQEFLVDSMGGRSYTE